MDSLCLAYYCSGHGYGHATRVSAFASQLLALKPGLRVHIVSSAPQHVFSNCMALGASYRCAEIDPVIVQPLAYRVDREKSVDVLRNFLSKKDVKLEQERRWLAEIGAHCVLSDAAFLGCLAAKAARLPSILMTNFTFDSVYSYLSTTIRDTTSPYIPQTSPQLYPASTSTIVDALIPDTPVPHHILTPLVDQLRAGYDCADLLVLLPGAIPIPSFPSFSTTPLPSTSWVDPATRTFYPHIVHSLSQKHPHPYLHPHNGDRKRSTISAPLIVRPPSAPIGISPYMPEGRARLLASIGIPSHLHDPQRTRILVVCFGGHVFRRPRSTASSKSGSSRSSPSPTAITFSNGACHGTNGAEKPRHAINGGEHGIKSPAPRRLNADVNLVEAFDKNGSPDEAVSPHRLATPLHLWIPGAPPAYKPYAAPPSTTSPLATPFSINTSPPTPEFKRNFGPDSPLEGDAAEFEEDARLLPDESWIAVICGVSKEQWLEQYKDEGEEGDGLPDGFYVAPKDVYMPDVMAVGDVLLGKLGYGTVSECVDSCTPFVYVSRPLFIEEFGLRLLLDQEGVGVELSREAYERGEWAGAVEDAWHKGKDAKLAKRVDEREVVSGHRVRSADEPGMVARVIDWVEEWWENKKGHIVTGYMNGSG